MNTKTLFLAWQDKARTRKWFPVGRLDVQQPESLYRFTYLLGAERAKKESGFEPLIDFPDLHRSYEASDLFPLFQNRVLTPGRRDFQEYLRQLDLPEQADPIEILSVDGGYRATDSFEVFPKIESRADGTFLYRFFLHGSRHLNPEALARLERLRPGDKLIACVEINNPVTVLAVQVQTIDYQMIGWTPRYLVGDLINAIARSPSKLDAKIVKVNPVPAPSKQRVLIEFRGHWPKNYEPMSDEDFIQLPV
jgi:hypothetical protein